MYGWKLRECKKIFLKIESELSINPKVVRRKTTGPYHHDHINYSKLAKIIYIGYLSLKRGFSKSSLDVGKLITS